MSARMKPTCPRCGSDSICRDAAARWCHITGKWDLAGVQDCMTCDDCGADEIDPVWVSVFDAYAVVSQHEYALDVELYKTEGEARHNSMDFVRRVFNRTDDEWPDYAAFEKAYTDENLEWPAGYDLSIEGVNYP